MTQYIDKSALVAELNRLIAELVEEGEDTMFEQGRISAFEDAKLFIDTLEVKEIGVDIGDPKGDVGVKTPVGDLEEAAREAATWHSHVAGEIFFPNDYQKFIAGAKWQEAQFKKNIKEE